MRPPVIEDVPFVYECLKDWPPHPVKGWVTFDKVDAWVRRWIHRDDEQAMIWENMGLMHYRLGPYHDPLGRESISPGFGVIDGIAVHPDHRRKGYSRIMRADLKKHLFAQGVMGVTFRTLPGPMRKQYGEDGVESAWM